MVNPDHQSAVMLVSKNLFSLSYCASRLFQFDNICSLYCEVFCQKSYALFELCQPQVALISANYILL